MRFRPYADGTGTRVAAVWTRDGRNWRIASGLTPDEIRRQDEREPDGEIPPGRRRRLRDNASDGQPADRYAALWVEKSGDDDARLYLGATDDDLTEAQKPLDDAKLIPRTLHALRRSDGRVRYSGVWGKPPSAGVTTQGYRDLFAWDYAENQALFSDRVLVDVAVGEAGKRLSARERARAASERAEKTLQTKPDDLRALWPAPGPACGSGKTTRPSTTSTPCLPRARTTRRARTPGDRAGAARQEGSRPRRPGKVSEGRAGTVPALPGGRRRRRTRRRGRRRDRGPGGRAQEGADDADLRYAAARAFAVASKAVDRPTTRRRVAWPARSLALLKKGSATTT